MAERAEGGGARQGARGFAEGERGGVQAGHESGGDGFDVAFDAGDLAGEEDFGARAQLQRGGEQRGGVDVGVAVDLSEAEELGVLEAGDEAQDARLFAELHVVLEADEVVAVGAEIFLAELHDGPGTAAGARVVEAHGLHGAEAEGVAAAARDLFDGEAGLEVGGVVFGNVGGDGVGFEQLVDESARTGRGRAGS